MLNPVSAALGATFAAAQSLLQTLKSHESQAHLYEAHREKLRSLLNEWLDIDSKAASTTLVERVNITS